MFKSYENHVYFMHCYHSSHICYLNMKHSITSIFTSNNPQQKDYTFDLMYFPNLLLFTSKVVEQYEIWTSLTITRTPMHFLELKLTLNLWMASAISTKMLKWWNDRKCFAEMLYIIPLKLGANLLLLPYFTGLLMEQSRSELKLFSAKTIASEYHKRLTE